MSAQYHIPPPSLEEAPHVELLASRASVCEMSGGAMAVGMAGEPAGQMVRTEGGFSAFSPGQEAPVATGAPYIGALQALALCRVRRRS